MNDMPPSQSDSAYVYVPVPVGRVEDVFRFLLGVDTDESAERDLEGLVRRLYRESDQQFRKLLHLLAERAGEPLSTEEVADELELERGTASLAGMLGAFGRRSNNRYDSFWPFERLYNASADESELMMSEHIAGIVSGLGR